MERLMEGKLKEILKILFGKNTDTKEQFIKEMIEESEEKKIISDDEKDLVEGIFELEETLIGEIMVPRVDVKAVPFDESLNDIVELINRTGKSRIIVYQDNIDNIVGIIYSKDILKFFKTDKELYAVEIVRPPYFVPETKSALSTLREFQKNHISIAVVIDEYGGVAGIVTMEDIIEEIVGEIQDELEKEDLDYKKIDENTYLVSGMMNLDDFNENIGSNFVSEDVNSIGGFVVSKLEHLPKKGEVLKIGNYEIKILETHKHRINRLLVKDLGKVKEK
ncbi:TPA: magnesium/cobalt efflux protein [candidate division WOR-3]|uniref:Magnesium/cobalt efflux protein n=2 Tax=Bacteria candidate phyla TaxID=1783234 RepID=A0A348MMI6_UNCW3|nr:magnesium/cobalt efflux protein [candidate division WOR-3 bacterium]HCP17245.1 magnesium/cobalt efflux protein [candidate division WOR-3 bacterium]